MHGIQPNGSSDLIPHAVAHTKCGRRRLHASNRLQGHSYKAIRPNPADGVAVLTTDSRLSKLYHTKHRPKIAHQTLQKWAQTYRQNKQHLPSPSFESSRRQESVQHKLATLDDIQGTKVKSTNMPKRSLGAILWMPTTGRLAVGEVSRNLRHSQMLCSPVRNCHLLCNPSSHLGRKTHANKALSRGHSTDKYLVPV